MAEFKEVMKNWIRARKATSSGNLDEETLTCIPLNRWDDAYIAGLEAEVNKWAENNPPEPQYPSWRKFLEGFGIVVRPEGTLEFMYTRDADKPIPESLAKALGVPLEPPDI